MQKISVIIDTFSWKKLDIIEKQVKILNLLYNAVNICVTHEILKEIKHFRLTSCEISRVHILPTKSNRIYQDSKTLGFDEADASLISNITKNEEYIGVTEDQSLLSLGTRNGCNIMQLLDLFQFFTAQGKLPKNTLYKITQELRNLKNITKKKEKYMKEWLQRN